FLADEKLTIETRAYLTQLAELFAPQALEAELARLAAGGARIALDPALAADRLRMIIEDNGGAVLHRPDPARLPRATKNHAELEGARAAHRRDGAAMARFLCWLDAQEPGTTDEIGAVKALEGFRRDTAQAVQMPLRDI